MAFEEILRSVTMEANADLSTAQYRFLVLDGTTGRVNLAGAGGDAYGVLQNKPKGVGHAATVARSGISKVVAGEAIARGDAIASDATGRAVVAGTGEATCGRAVLAATGAGQIISVDLELLGGPNAS